MSETPAPKKASAIRYAQRLVEKSRRKRERRWREKLAEQKKKAAEESGGGEKGGGSKGAELEKATEVEVDVMDTTVQRLSSDTATLQSE